jgi:hypothetical protein
MAEGGSFFSQPVGEPNRRAFFELDRRIAAMANSFVGFENPYPDDVLFEQDVEVDGTLTANHIHGNLAGAVYLHVKNTSGVTIPAGSPVYATGSVGASGATEVAVSDADNASTMPALGVLQSTLVNNGEGHATVLGVAKHLDTSAWSVNDSLYVSTSGTLTNVRPTGASELVQKIGRVVRVDASTGEVLVLGAGRANDVPNYIVAGGLTIDTDTLHVDSTNNRVGIGTTTPAQALEVSGRIKATGISGNSFPLELNTDTTSCRILMKDANSTSSVVVGSETDDLIIRTNNNERVRVDSSGNVGIGDTTPSYKLDVNGTLRATDEIRAGGFITIGASSTAEGGEIRLDGGTSYSANYARIDRYGNNLLRFMDQSEVRMSLDITNGNLSVSGTVYAGTGTSSVDVLQIRNEVQASNGSASDPSYTFSSDGDTGMYRHTTNSIGFTTGNIQHYWNGNGIYLANGDWFRTTGNSGWYSQTHGGGWFMQDSSWVRVYNSKHLYTNGGKFEARHINSSNDWSVQSCIITSSTDHGYAGRSFDGDSHTGQLRPASGTWYVRNHNDGAYWGIAAVVYNQSSRRMKQDIETWGKAKSLSSAVNVTYDTTATDLVKKLRPVTYRLKKHERLPRDIPNERRHKALGRLNQYLIANGLEQYSGEEAIHECGRDCEGSLESPCAMYANWERGTIGFIAEEVGEVIPAATEMELRPRSHHIGENTAIDGLALTAVLTKAIQEIEARLSALESS